LNGEKENAIPNPRTIKKKEKKSDSTKLGRSLWDSHRQAKKKQSYHSLRVH
jgi:hypothetical protein